MPADPLIGYLELAKMVGVQRRTVHQWAWRGVLPPADAQINGRPVWRRSTIKRWAAERRRERPNAFVPPV